MNESCENSKVSKNVMRLVKLRKINIKNRRKGKVSGQNTHFDIQNTSGTLSD